MAFLRLSLMFPSVFFMAVSQYEHMAVPCTRSGQSDVWAVRVVVISRCYGISHGASLSRIAQAGGGGVHKGVLPRRGLTSPQYRAPHG